MAIPAPPPTLARQASGAVFWNALAKFGTQLFQLIVAAVLARLLSPEDFGLVAMVFVFSGFVSAISSAGMSSAVVQFRALDAEDFGTVLCLSLIVGGVMTLLFAGLATPIAAFYGLPEIAPVVVVISISFLVAASSRVPLGLLERQLAFRTIALIRVTAALVGGVIGIAAALLNGSYWALIAQLMCTEVLTTVLIYAAARWRPRLRFDRRVARMVIGFSGHLTLFNVINHSARNFDNLLIGRLLGAASLGFYNRAYALMLYPVNVLATVVTPVLHPVLVDMQGDTPRMSRAYLRIARLIAMLSFPLMTVLGLLAPEVIQIVWGPGWERSGPVFRILCVVGAVQSIVSASSSIFLAVGRANLLLRIGTLNAIAAMSGIAIGLRWGIEGVAIGYTVAACLTALPTLYWVSSRLLCVPPVDFLLALVKPIGLAVLTALPLVWLNTTLAGNLSPLSHVSLGLAVSFVTYALALRTIAPDLLAEFCALLPEGLGYNVLRLARMSIK